MTGDFSVENTLIDRSDRTNQKYSIPKNFPSFLLTGHVRSTVRGTRACGGVRFRLLKAPVGYCRDLQGSAGFICLLSSIRDIKLIDEGCGGLLYVSTEVLGWVRGGKGGGGSICIC